MVDWHRLSAEAMSSLWDRWTHKGLEHESSGGAGGALTAADDSDDESEAFPLDICGSEEASAGHNASVPDLDRVIDTWQRSSILVGMHPDQARSAFALAQIVTLLVASTGFLMREEAL